MVSPEVGTVVLVTFPFSDLSATKLRPAIVLAAADRDDWILCQVTSAVYSDPRAIEITDSDFAVGSLARRSYARPGKLFSANTSIMRRVVGSLKREKQETVVDAVIAILRPNI
ncbi:MAG: MazF family transcriptional regulator [Spirochaetaceae bacterium]|nr:MAG: MazF family transcriptional regulator [Spirochaetaceae bacterium]